MKEKRYYVWQDSESNVKIQPVWFNDLDSAHGFASDFVHAFDNMPFRVIAHVEDATTEETVDTVENTPNRPTRHDIWMLLLQSMDSDTATLLARKMEQYVVDDVQACADEEYNDDDIRLAIGRYLREAIGEDDD